MDSQPLLRHSNKDRNKHTETTTANTAWVYIELTRVHTFPLGSSLIFWPALWALTLAAHRTGQHPAELALLSVLFALGSTLLHCAACTLNDICDVEFDRKVERCSSRPLVTGKASFRGAWALFAFLVLFVAGMLLLTHNITPILLGAFDLFPLHALYPMMKRWTDWPQAWLGIALNWIILVAWTTTIPDISSLWPIPILLLLGTTCWTIVYDTEYASQDVHDDAAAGVRSTARLFGAAISPILASFATVFVATLIAVGTLNGQGPVYYLVSVGGTIVHFAWQFRTWRVDVPQDGEKLFKANHYLAIIVWVGLVLDYALHLH